MTTMDTRHDSNTPSVAIGLTMPGGEDPRAAWFGELARRAGARAEALGFPRRTDEEWRYTNPSPLLEALRDPAEPGILEGADPVDTIGIDACARLVFVDGRFAPSISSIGETEGIRVETLDRAPEQVLAPIADRAIEDARDGLEALGAGLMGSGVLIRVRQGARIERPIVLVFRAESTGAPVLTTPSVFVLAEEGSSVCVIEDHQGAEGAGGMTLGRTEIHAARDAVVDHTTLEREPETRHHVSTVRIIQQSSSHVHAARILLGGGVVRNQIHATLGGEHCETSLPGVFAPQHAQHHDTHIRVEHLAEDCNSRQHYRGVLADKSRGVFTGRIWVKDTAQKTDAIQHNSNLLLSREARVTTKPQLEIYADDVRCTHGATSGQLDDDALFYLRARAVPEPVARLLLTHAFVGDAVDRIAHAGVREAARSLIEHRLDAALARSAR